MRAPGRGLIPAFAPYQWFNPFHSLFHCTMSSSPAISTARRPRNSGPGSDSEVSRHGGTTLLDLKEGKRKASSSSNTIELPSLLHFPRASIPPNNAPFTAIVVLCRKMISGCEIFSSQRQCTAPPGSQVKHPAQNVVAHLCHET